MKSEVFNEDCMIGMSCFPDNHFDLAVVDPLYGISVTSWPLGSHPTRSRTDGFGSGPAISTIARMKQAKMQGAGQLKNRTLNNHSMHWDIAPGPEYFTELFRISKNQ
ncbi:MAG: hypothetical protein ACTHMC_01585, partial [Pseudobacter sp.]|uniref:hypothetical protein n=1 Tax=Pseudobacter sp. TaxID=2045420 RepID=UPI003F7FDEEA